MVEEQEPSETTTAATKRNAEPLAARMQVVPGRLATLSGMALVAGLIPLPFVPTRVLRQLRGAVAHDVLSRHGFSLVSDARAILAEPNSRDRLRKLLRKSLEVITRRLLRRLGPLSAFSTAVSAFEVYALGHLLDRYVRHVRPPGTVRVYEAEALRVRQAIDAAVLRTFSPATDPRPLVLPSGPEDFRDEFTRWVDTLLLTGATLPSYLQRRLEAAFDDVVANSPGLNGA